METGGGSPDGVKPLIGTLNPNTMAFTSAVVQVQGMTNGGGCGGCFDERRYIVEMIHLSRDNGNYNLFAFARKRDNNFKNHVNNDRSMLIVGRDHLAPTAWAGDVGCFTYSTFLITMSSPR